MSGKCWQNAKIQKRCVENLKKGRQFRLLRFLADEFADFSSIRPTQEQLLTSCLTADVHQRNV